MPVPDAERILDLLLRANRLKTTPRTGWAVRGVPAPESVADHSHGTALLALLLCELVPEPLDRARALAMAVLHDLPECEIGDLTAGAVRHLPEGAKTTAEASALDALLAGLSVADRWRELWREYEARRTPEARLVRDADRLDLLLQALVYERATGHRGLDGFWRRAGDEPFAFAASGELAAALAARRSPASPREGRTP
jgi:putative hydrolase of HD superfamily